MASFEDRVRRILREEAADIRMLMLDDTPTQSPSIAPHPINGSYGLEGVKAELQKVEQMVSYLFLNATEEESEENDPRADEAKKEALDLVSTMIGDDSNDEDSTWWDRVCDWFKRWSPDVDINILPGLEIDTQDIFVTQGIRQLPLPAKFKAMLLLGYGAGSKLLKSIKEEIDFAFMAGALKTLSQTKSDMRTMLLKMENEVLQNYNLLSKVDRDLSELEVPIPPATNNSIAASNNMLQTLLAEVADLRGLL